MNTFENWIIRSPLEGNWVTFVPTLDSGHSLLFDCFLWLSPFTQRRIMADGCQIAQKAHFQKMQSQCIRNRKWGRPVFYHWIWSMNASDHLDLEPFEVLPVSHQIYGHATFDYLFERPRFQRYSNFHCINLNFALMPPACKFHYVLHQESWKFCQLVEIPQKNP